MKVFVAGGGGAVGKRLIPSLARAGHSVVAMTRSPDKADAIRAAGAEPVIADALDAGEMMDAVVGARPEVVVHQLTALPSRFDLRRFEREFVLTDRLRTEGTDHLVAAARAAGARRLVAQSFAGWPYAREGGPVKTEEHPLDPDPPAGMGRTLDAIRHLEATVLGAEGIEGVVLRYGAFYGPGTSLAEDGQIVEAVRRRRFPLVGRGKAVWSFVHIDDVAEATLAAVQGGPPGIYNIVDDEPAPVSDWLPALATAAGAKAPWRVPALVGRLALGGHGLSMMTQIRGASNEKARRELGWRPAHSTWREGFPEVLAH
jgi:nucleoside-diphosphate-sugar epimerase